MSVMLALILTLQGGGWATLPARPAVGDTVRIERVVPAPRGAVGRARALDAGDLLEPLRPPEIVPADGGLRVRYTVALFAPGRHALAMPALEVVHPDGGVELVLGDTVVVEVRSVLPDSAEAPAPRASRAPLARLSPSPGPLLATLGGASALLAAWAAYRRRRSGGAAPAPAAAPLRPPPPPLMRWLALGERRAVATLAMDRLRRRVEEAIPASGRGLALADCLARAAAERPAWPIGDLEELLGALERARFAPLAADDLTELVDRTDVLLARLDAPPADGPPA